MHRYGAIIGEDSVRRFRHFPASACADFEISGTNYACNRISSYAERLIVKEQYCQ